MAKTINKYIPQNSVVVITFDDYQRFRYLSNLKPVNAKEIGFSFWDNLTLQQKTSCIANTEYIIDNKQNPLKKDISLSSFEIIYTDNQIVIWKRENQL